MKWLQHHTNASRDEDLVEMFAEFGHKGYSVWWLILERIGERIDEKGISELTYREKIWCRYLTVRSQFLRNYLAFMTERGKLTSQLKDGYLTIGCPKLLKLHDTYTGRHLKKKSQGSNTVRTDFALEEKKREDTPPTPPKGGFFENDKSQKRKPKDHDPDGFNRFWNAWPRKVNKSAALKSWNRLKPDHELQAVIIADAEARTKGDPVWTKDGGRFIPHASTYLNGQRWLDEWTPTLAGDDSEGMSPAGPETRKVRAEDQALFEKMAQRYREASQ